MKRIIFHKLKNNSIDDLPETCVQYCNDSLNTNASCNKVINDEWWQN